MFKGKGFHVWHGAVELVLVVAIPLVTAAAFGIVARLAGGASTAPEGA